jgi:hypothetical protein
MNILTPLPGVCHILFDSRKDLTLALCRIQEFHESPHDWIRGKHFTFGEFVEAYMNEKGVIDYWSYWDGFNVPRETMDRFNVMFFDKTDREVDVLQAAIESEYLIATAKDSHANTLPHELAHAKYALDAKYKEAMQKMVHAIPPKTKHRMMDDLVSLRYPSVNAILEDEIQAYLLTSSLPELAETFASIRPLELDIEQRRFREAA